MKALTLWQPWASLIAVGAKTIETRSWSTKYRGPLAIHAAKRRPDTEMGEEGPVGEIWQETSGDQYDNCLVQWAQTDAVDYHPGTAPPADERWWFSMAPDFVTTRMPLGAVVATCELVDVVPIDGMNEAGHDHFVCPSIYGDLTLYRFGHGGSQPSTLEEDITDQLPYGYFSEPGRFAWLLDMIRPLDVPVLAKGRQGFWNWEPTA